MGGHGGLNILPQKKWNVYNWDNRLKVQKDKRIAQEKKEQQERVEHNQQARGRIQQLKKTKGNYSHTPSPSNSSREKQLQEKPTVTSKISIDLVNNKLDADLKKIAKEKKNINLFEKEEEQMIRKENTQAYIEMEKEFFKDKPFDLSSKFLGQFSDANQPWYLKSNATADKEGQIKVREQIDSFRKQTNQFYQVLKLKENEEPQEESVKNEELIKQEELDRTAIRIKQEAKQKKEELKKQEKLQKLALELKAMLGQDSESEEEKEEARKQLAREKSQLRKERMLREKSEKQKVCKLMSQKYGFKYD